MMCCRAFSLLHIIGIGWLHLISCFSLDCGVLMGVPLGSSCSPSLLSLSTSEFRSPSHGGNLNRSASLSCTERAPECGSVGGSVTQIPGTPFQYIPDFCVRALTDLQFVKVTILVPVSPRRCIFILEDELCLEQRRPKPVLKGRTSFVPGMWDGR